MKGFDTEALILFPNWEHYVNKSPTYKMQLNRATTNLVQYFKSIGIQPYAFYTDDVARALRKDGILFINPLGDADTFFIQKYCDAAGDAMTLSMRHFTDIENEVIAKDPGELKMSVEDRFEMVLRHINKSTSKIIPLFKIVANISLPKKSQYKVTSKPGDGKIRINISASTFAPKVYMSGVEEDTCDLFGARYANRCLDQWEV